MREIPIPTRRDFLRKSRRAVMTTVMLGTTSWFARAEANKQKSAKRSPAEDVSPVEDLMREHGVLDRLLLVYEGSLMRLSAGRECPPEVVSGAANLIRRFIEDYHEKLEEDYLFPRFEKKGKLGDVVRILRQQHQAGRYLTDSIQSGATPAGLKNQEDRRKLQESLRLFIGMYRPHAAREDTILFPTLHSLVSLHEYDSLGEEFEEQEQALFGKDGFETIVDEVAELEKTLGLYDLSQFTPTNTEQFAVG
jgi:hemerythrin-like domain-containing protein